MRNGPYVLVVAPCEYPGKKYRGRYVYEHHLVWWRETGEVVPDGKTIHHVNGDKHDNRFENLELHSRKFHSQLHARHAEKAVLICAWCGGTFERAVRNARFKQKQGQENFFCCRSHQVKHQHAERWSVG